MTPVSISDDEVQIQVEGKQSVIGNLKSSDFVATLVLSGISSPGTYDVPINVSMVNPSGEYQILSVRPEKVQVRLDQLDTKTLSVDVDVKGVTVPEGYILESVYSSHKEVTLSGPAKSLENITQCVAKVTESGEFSKTTVVKVDLQFLNAQGEEVQLTDVTASRETVDVTIPVLKKKVLPVVVNFLNAPPGFDLNTLQYELSQNTIEIAGPPDLIDAMTQYSLGYIDLTETDLNEPRSFTIELPVGYLNVENVETITVEFSADNFDRITLAVTDIRLNNPPSGYDVTINTQRIRNVTVIGRSGTIDSLVAGDLVAEISLGSAELQVGQYEVPVTIYAPSKNDVWAYGDYSVVVTVRQK